MLIPQITRRRTLQVIRLFARIQWPSILLVLLVSLHRSEEDPRMKYGQAQHRNAHHDAIQRDEFWLILHDRIPPAASHFRNAKDTTCEDGEEGDEERRGEKLERG